MISCFIVFSKNPQRIRSTDVRLPSDTYFYLRFISIWLGKSRYNRCSSWVPLELRLIFLFYTSSALERRFYMRTLIIQKQHDITLSGYVIHPLHWQCHVESTSWKWTSSAYHELPLPCTVKHGSRKVPFAAYIIHTFYLLNKYVLWTWLWLWFIIVVILLIMTVMSKSGHVHGRDDHEWCSGLESNRDDDYG